MKRPSAIPFKTMLTPAAAALLMFSSINSNAAGSYVPHDILQQLAEAEVESQFIVPDGHQGEVEAAKIDPRQHLPHCRETIETKLVGRTKIHRTNSVQLSCSQPEWNIYITVRTKLLRSVPTVNQAIARGAMIEAHMLQDSLVDVYQLRGKFIDTPEQALGTRTKRNLQPGAVLSQNQICLVCRGDELDIIAQADGLALSTKGEALADGLLGDEIRVKNVRSNRIIRAKVTGAGQVAIQIN